MHMVSVCMASYNGEEFIHEQIKSILNQLKPEDELIISDDGSTDHTLKIIAEFNDPRIHVYDHPSTGRPTENFEYALERASGEFIFLSDQDDLWLEGKYEMMIKLLSSCDLVLSNSVLVDEQLNTIHPSFFNFHGSAKGIIRNVIKNSYFGSCMAFRKELLNYALPFPASREIGHDVWLGLIAEMVGKVCLTEQPLILYRRHAAAVTPHGMGKSKRSLFVKLLGRVIMFKYVFIFYIKYLLNGRRLSVYHNSNV